MVLQVDFSSPAKAEAPINPGGPFVPPDKDANQSAIVTFDEVEAKLLKLEQPSKGVMTLDGAGLYSRGLTIIHCQARMGPGKEMDPYRKIRGV